MIPIAALFDLDGVIVDTESEYTHIWDTVRRRYRSDDINLAHNIKGKTLRQIFDDYFPDPRLQAHIMDYLIECEQKLEYRYIPGVASFIDSLRRNNMRLAIVTSSNRMKMDFLFARRPELASWVDTIITADDITRSKPHPECYLLAAKRLQVPIQQCVVFEDSLAGITAGKASGAFVVGVATTLPHNVVAAQAHSTIPHFAHFSYEQLLACARQY